MVVNWVLEDRERKRTREVVKKRDLNGAAHDGVHPKPPTGSKDGAGDAGAEYCPQFREIH
ncbi:hypothetical protein HanHA300_Chr09g0321861 [Helianthus annuus]|nr:hypothetical protein HanHA300_Chr09g0321861 [Helianthus annuus]KAJ0542716.1 hypothetical protein HanHA89_Chr09g0342811 [Helianthus annuus]KAJ0707776.1 hypothetical protein HanLR1_Chr09g0322141 [Helianthus annuus]